MYTIYHLQKLNKLVLFKEDWLRQAFYFLDLAFTQWLHNMLLKYVISSKKASAIMSAIFILWLGLFLFSCSSPLHQKSYHMIWNEQFCFFFSAVMNQKT